MTDAYWGKFENLAENTVPVSPTSSAGMDNSNAPPALLTLLVTFTVKIPGAYRIQNQSAGTLQVVFDDGGSGTDSILLLAPGGPNAQGSGTDPEMPWFFGRIRVYGAVGAQFFARYA